MPGLRDLTFKRVTASMRNTSQRNLYLAAAAIPGHLAMAGWKGALLVVTPSLFILGNVVFTLGLAIVKGVVVASGRHDRRAPDGRSGVRAYRSCGWIVLVFAIAYLACCFPIAFGLADQQQYGHIAALAIAAVTFAELGFSIHGFFSSRQRGDLLMEAVKLSNLASSLILLVLTQTALLSITASGSAPLHNGIAGVVMGCGAAAIGAHMLVRSAKLGRIPRSK